MSGFDNEVVVSIGERLQPSTSQAILLMQKNPTDVSRINFTGDPEGSVSANPGSLCHDPVGGQVYRKATGTGNTGWRQWGNLLNDSSFVPKGSAVSLTTATPANITNLSLGGGTWAISAMVQFGGTPTISGPQQASISLNSATHGDLGDNMTEAVWQSNLFPVADLPLVIPTWVVELESTTTVYLVASGFFSGGDLSAYGRLTAVQVENPI